MPSGILTHFILYPKCGLLRHPTPKYSLRVYCHGIRLLARFPLGSEHSICQIVKHSFAQNCACEPWNHKLNTRNSSTDIGIVHVLFWQMIMVHSFVAKS